MVLGRVYQPPQRRPMDLTCHHLETMTRKDDMGDQPSGGETTWTNTGATRSDRTHHKTGMKQFIFAQKSHTNLAWLVCHGLALSDDIRLEAQLRV